MNGKNRKKVIVLGDGACGKTSLLILYKEKRFRQEYIPTIFDTYVTDVDVDGVKVQLVLCDTAGQEDYDRLRLLSYPETDVVLLCFSIDNRLSLDNIPTNWLQEIREQCPGVPIILVGNKCDLRRDEETLTRLREDNQEPVSPEEGQEMCRRVRAHVYLECSAKTAEGVHEVFDTAVRATLKPKKRCTLL